MSRYEDGPCPVCGQPYYRQDSGEYDEGEQISPATGECSLCGFTYSQHVQHPMTEQVDEFKKTLYSERFAALARIMAEERQKMTGICKAVMEVADSCKELDHPDLTAKIERALLPLLWNYDYETAERIESKKGD